MALCAGANPRTALHALAVVQVECGVPLQRRRQTQNAGVRGVLDVAETRVDVNYGHAVTSFTRDRGPQWRRARGCWYENISFVLLEYLWNYICASFIFV